MQHPLFSCVVPVKGARPYMGEALASLLASVQGIDDCELEIIVQDADVEVDTGQSDALNKGFAKAQGEWLFWLNADDVLLPGALRKVKNLIDCHKRKPVEWIAGNTVYIDKQGKVMDARCDARWRPWFGKYMSVWTGGPGAFFHRDLWQRHGGFDIDLRFVMDLDLWTCWAQRGVRFESIEDYIWGFRVHADSTTSKGENKHAMALEFQKVLRRYNIEHEAFWRGMARMTSVFDGTRWRRIRDSYRLRNKSVFDCVGLWW